MHPSNTDDATSAANAHVHWAMQARYSAMLEFFHCPVIAVWKQEFEFSRKQISWPHRTLLEQQLHRLDMP
jgi:hypothetical protein